MSQFIKEVYIKSKKSLNILFMIYLVPSFISENSVETIPLYVMSAVKNCQVIFAENERTARRFLKSMEMKRLPWPSYSSPT
jgi:16S rRNA C1402 (ribose-2'-O) methylase RsmI